MSIPANRNGFLNRKALRPNKITVIESQFKASPLTGIIRYKFGAVDNLEDAYVFAKYYGWSDHEKIKKLVG